MRISSTWQLIKDNTLCRVEFLRQIWSGLQQGVRVSQILQPFRAAAGRVGSRTELFMQEIDTRNDAETYIVEGNFLGAGERCREGRVSGKLYWCPVWPSPVFGMTKASRQSETCRFELEAGNLTIIGNGHIDIKGCAGLCLMHLESNTANNRIRHFYLGKDACQCLEGWLFRAFHLTS
jgi:hypothetical protein